MLLLLLKKELKVFFTNKTNIAFMVVLPIMIVFLLAVCLESYMDADYDTFQNGKVFYYADNPTEEVRNHFMLLSQKINQATGVEVEEVYDYEKAKGLVESSHGYGVITLSESGIAYYRSPYNETGGGKIIRSLYKQFIAAPVTEKEYVSTITWEARAINAKVYYTFYGLTFVLMYMALLAANATYEEREWRTIDRIQISKAGVSSMFLSKILTGILCGIGMIVVVYLFSRFFLGVCWGEKTPVMLVVLLLLALCSAVFGSVLGMISKNKSMHQDIVLIMNMLFGYLGGAFLPIHVLENSPILKLLAKISPLYWTNRSLASLYQGSIDNNTYASIAVLAGLSAIILLLYGISTGKGKRKSVV